MTAPGQVGILLGADPVRGYGATAQPLSINCEKLRYLKQSRQTLTEMPQTKTPVPGAN